MLQQNITKPSLIKSCDQWRI